METKKIKVILTKVGTAYEPTKEYHLHDYIVIDNVTIYTCKRVDKETMFCVGHPLTDTAYWDKSVDLSEALAKATKATNDAITATQEATKATTNATTATTNANKATENAKVATTNAETATSNANSATTRANNAAAGAEKVDATLDNDTLSVTDRTGAMKQLELITNAKAIEIEQKLSSLFTSINIAPLCDITYTGSEGLYQSNKIANITFVATPDSVHIEFIQLGWFETQKKFYLKYRVYVGEYCIGEYSANEEYDSIPTENKQYVIKNRYLNLTFTYLWSDIKGDTTDYLVNKYGNGASVSLSNPTVGLFGDNADIIAVMASEKVRWQLGLLRNIKLSLKNGFKLKCSMLGWQESTKTFLVSFDLLSENDTLLANISYNKQYDTIPTVDSTYTFVINYIDDKIGELSFEYLWSINNGITADKIINSSIGTGDFTINNNSNIIPNKYSDISSDYVSLSKNIKLNGTVSTTSNPSKGIIASGLKKGQKLVLKSNNVSFTNPSSIIIGINADGTWTGLDGLYGVIVNNNGTFFKAFTLKDDIEKVHLVVVASDTINDLSLDMDIYVNNYVSVVSDKVDSVEKKVDSVEKKVDSVTKIGDEDNFVEIKGIIEVKDWIYGEKYFGVKKQVIEDSILVSLSTAVIHDGEEPVIRKAFKIVIGTIDQRGWLIPRKVIDAPIKSSNLWFNNVETVNLSIPDNTIVNKGEYIFVKTVSTQDDNNGASVLLGINNTDFEIVVASGWNTPVTTSQFAPNLKVTLKSVSSVFAYKSTTDYLNDRIDTQQTEINNNKIYTDLVNGNKYKITIQNGVLVPKSLTVKRLLFIGHSYTTNSYNNAFNFGMCPSRPEHSASKLVEAMTGATSFNTILGKDLEQTINENYDASTDRSNYKFAKKWNISDEWDAICIILRENVSTDYANEVYGTWRSMLQYLKTAAPSAEIYCYCGEFTYNKTMTKGITKACQDEMVTPIHSTLRSGEMCPPAGDFYYGTDNKWHAVIGGSGVDSHPNDYGFCLIADAFLAAMGYNMYQTSHLHNVTINQAAGGAITVQSSKQLTNGYVTVHIKPDSNHTLSSLSIVDSEGNSIDSEYKSVTETNGKTYTGYVFTMPNYDVTITPVWT